MLLHLHIIACSSSWFLFYVKIFFTSIVFLLYFTRPPLISVWFTLALIFFWNSTWPPLYFLTCLVFQTLPHLLLYNVYTLQLPLPILQSLLYSLALFFRRSLVSVNFYLFFEYSHWRLVFLFVVLPGSLFADNTWHPLYALHNAQGPQEFAASDPCKYM